MARPITLAGSVFILVSFSSALCLAVQSDTDPVFPKTLRGALIDGSTQLGRVIPPRTTHQQQRRGGPVNQPFNSVLVNQNTRRGQPKTGADNRATTPSAGAQRSSEPRLAKLPPEQLNQNKRDIKLNSIPTLNQLAKPTLVEPARDVFQVRANQRVTGEANSAAPELSIRSSNEIASVEETEERITTLADLDSEADFGTVMTFPDGDSCSSAKIVVHPPESTEDNEFSFFVQNIGSAKSEPFLVEFETPGDVSIMQVFPFGAKTTRNKVVVEFEGLASGSQQPVHIKTTASTQGKFSFQTRIRMEKVHAFEVETGESTPPQITRPNEGMPLQFASTGGAGAGTTHRLTDIPETGAARQPAQVNTDNRANEPQGSLPEVALTTSLTGSEVLVEGREHEFEIIVKNRSQEMATEIVVQLATPGGLMITNLDREAWIDQQQRTVSWKIDNIEAGQAETIVYRVKALSRDEQYQKIVVGMRNTYQGEVDFSSKVILNQQPQEAPRPAFEK
jgi:hypothetical protein